MTCDFCRRAAEGPEHGFRPLECRGCAARMAARAQPFFDSKKCGHQTAEYRALLWKFAVTHEEVLAAAKADWLKGDRR